MNIIKDDNLIMPKKFVLYTPKTGEIFDAEAAYRTELKKRREEAKLHNAVKKYD